MASLRERLALAREEMGRLADEAERGERAFRGIERTEPGVPGGAGGGDSAGGGGGVNFNFTLGGSSVAPGGGGALASIGGGAASSLGSVTIGRSGVSRDAEYIAKAVIGSVGGLAKAVQGNGGLLLRSGSGL